MRQLRRDSGVFLIMPAPAPLLAGGEGDGRKALLLLDPDRRRGAAATVIVCGYSRPWLFPVAAAQAASMVHFCGSQISMFSECTGSPDRRPATCRRQRTQRAPLGKPGFEKAPGAHEDRRGLEGS